MFNQELPKGVWSGMTHSLLNRARDGKEHAR